MKTSGKLALAGASGFLLLQFLRPGIPAKPATAELQLPADIHRIIEKDCYSCHSDERRLSWFDRIVPAYWLVRHDILTAREHLNFSTLGSKPAAAQKAALFEAVNMMQFGAMPLPQFTTLHPESKVSAEELAQFKKYLAPWAPITKVSAVSESSPNPISLTTVSPEYNGLAFDPSFESWKQISTTDRGDNNTFRFILGNDVAVKAAQSGDIAPWPDGTRFAKIAWQKELGPDGLLHPGKFVQVELMIKDAQRYKDADGWGWGRWRGLDLKPYGANAEFVKECVGCHRPMAGNDHVYTLPVTVAKVTHTEAVNNSAAELPAALPYQPFTWNLITLYVDPATRTIAVLYGNQAAMQSTHPRDGMAKKRAYVNGAVLALVTWEQREDPHWFGGRIPGTPKSVEFLQATAPGHTSSYRRFAGPGLVEDHPSADIATLRTKHLQELVPASLP